LTGGNRQTENYENSEFHNEQSPLEAARVADVLASDGTVDTDRLAIAGYLRAGIPDVAERRRCDHSQ